MSATYAPHRTTESPEEEKVKGLARVLLDQKAASANP